MKKRTSKVLRTNDRYPISLGVLLVEIGQTTWFHGGSTAQTPGHTANTSAAVRAGGLAGATMGRIGQLVRWDVCSILYDILWHDI